MPAVVGSEACRPQGGSASFRGDGAPEPAPYQDKTRNVLLKDGGAHEVDACVTLPCSLT